MDTNNYRDVHATAAAYGRAAGSTEATYVVQRRDPDTGELVELVRATWRADGSDPYSRGVDDGEREAAYRQAYDNASRDEVDAWFTGPTTGEPLADGPDAWAYERGFTDGWNSAFDGIEP